MSKMSKTAVKSLTLAQQWPMMCLFSNASMSRDVSCFSQCLLKVTQFISIIFQNVASVSYKILYVILSGLWLCFWCELVGRFQDALLASQLCHDITEGKTNENEIHFYGAIF